MAGAVSWRLPGLICCGSSEVPGRDDRAKCIVKEGLAWEVRTVLDPYVHDPLWLTMCSILAPLVNVLGLSGIGRSLSKTFLFL